MDVAVGRGVAVGIPPNGVGVGVPAKGVGVGVGGIGVVMGVAVGVPGPGVAVVGRAVGVNVTIVAPRPGVGVAVGGVPVNAAVGVGVEMEGVPNGGGVLTAVDVGVGLACPFGPVGSFVAGQAARSTANAADTRPGRKRSAGARIQSTLIFSYRGGVPPARAARSARAISSSRKSRRAFMSSIPEVAARERELP